MAMSASTLERKTVDRKDTDTDNADVETVGYDIEALTTRGKRGRPHLLNPREETVVDKDYDLATGLQAPIVDPDNFDIETNKIGLTGKYYEAASELAKRKLGESERQGPEILEQDFPGQAYRVRAEIQTLDDDELVNLVAEGAAANKDRQETERHRQAFEVWYENGQSFQRAAQVLGCSHMPLRRYAVWFDWVGRAQERAATVRVETAKEVTKKYVGAMVSHFDAASKLIGRGVEYLDQYGIDNPRDAIQAVKIGIELQRRIAELPDWVIKVKDADTNELLELADELTRAHAGAANDLLTRGAEETRSRIDAGEIGVLPAVAESTDDYHRRD